VKLVQAPKTTSKASLVDILQARCPRCPQSGRNSLRCHCNPRTAVCYSLGRSVMLVQTTLCALALFITQSKADRYQTLNARMQAAETEVRAFFFFVERGHPPREVGAAQGAHTATGALCAAIATPVLQSAAVPNARRWRCDLRSVLVFVITPKATNKASLVGILRARWQLPLMPTEWQELAAWPLQLPHCSLRLLRIRGDANADRALCSRVMNHSMRS
jgi:hypothetical protein